MGVFRAFWVLASARWSVQSVGCILQKAKKKKDLIVGTTAGRLLGFAFNNTKHNLAQYVVGKLW